MTALRRAQMRGAILGALTMAAALAGGGALAARILAHEPHLTLPNNLAAHLTAGTALLALAIAALGWRWIGLAGLALSTVVFGQTLYAAPWGQQIVPGPHDLRLVSFNVMRRNPESGAVADWLLASDADVVLLLEAAAMIPHLRSLESRFPHQTSCPDRATCEMLILSRVPIITLDAEAGPPHARDRLMIATVELDGGPFTLFATHWTKDFFAYLRGLEREALYWRIERHRRADGGPFAIAGDFNAAPWDFSITNLARRQELSLPSRWAPTWPVSAGWLGLPIDHVLIPRDVGVTAFETHPDPMGSNHRGLVADLVLFPAE
jgi:endonuclease/exonuclease/phosphatase (EEP) superfamily protein YafD